MEYILFFVLCVELLIGLLLVRDILHPTIILKIVWLLSVGFLLLYKNIWDVNLSFMTVLIFLMGIMFFDFGYLIVNSLNKYKKGSFKYHKKITKNITSKRKAFVVLIFMVILSLFVIYSSLNIVGSFQGVADFFVKLRYYMKRTDENTSYIQFIVRLLETLGVVFFLKLILENNSNSRKKMIYIFIILLSLFMLVFSTGRYRFLAIIIMFLYIFVINKRKSGKLISFSGQIKLIKLAFFSLFMFIIVFTLFGDLFFGKGNSNLIAEFARYVSGGLVAFNMTWESISNTSINFGSALLNPLYSIIENFLRISIKETSGSVLPTVYASNGFSTNVYTFYRQQIVDFGVVAIPFVMTFLGMFFAYLNIKSKEEPHVGFWTAVYAYFMFGIMTSPFQDFFFTNTTFHLISLFVLFIFLKTRVLRSNHFN